VIRPLQPADVPAAFEVQLAAFVDLDARLGHPPFEVTDEGRARGLARIAHLQGTDPGGAWVAEGDGRVVGAALALVRDGMWFLSLLFVAPDAQGRGLGRGLLDAALGTATDRAWLLSTEDPAAVRRYRRSGFVLHPTYTAKGALDRSRLPVVTGVQEGVDEDTMDAVLRAVRGAGVGPEARYLQERGMRVLVVPGRGFCVLRPQGTSWLAATDEATARALLVASLAEATDPVEIDWLGADQQWALDVCLDAGLALGPGGSVCLRGQPHMSPYLPSGAFG
jgi:GNAT superfamily N-acetyltransferase